MNAPMYSDPARKSLDKRTFGRAMWFSLAFVAIAAMTLITTVMWIGQCSISLDVNEALCRRHGTPMIALASPAVLLIGGIIAFVQTYRSWKRHESWWIWQGAGWFLLLLMVVNLMLAGRMMTT
ncbi:hypothetical protein [Mycobacteroides chelonae]|uniref:hypothetical protein n=1 Tax=Mycobacteroides chelonae TaxID=1774 RepID=UPI0007B42FE5|nr:hypothetical protein BB28_12625 [Mycobacteroides chelonae CCUG 47445]OLT72295.1 hypothetical protein BKG56_19775 [Mycobacteroides chelonae]ORV11614.1 hypothetical protein AWB96_19695 [Mycobacteroides chelonae]